MRKIILSLLVIISFIMYSFSLRSRSVSQIAVIAPTTLEKSKVSLIPLPTTTPFPPTPTATPHPQKQIIPTHPLPTATPQPIVPTVTPRPSSPYKDGTFTGSVADAFYGPIQVQVTISGGKITNVQFLQAPNDRGTSIMINQQADPMLAQEAIQAQSANVDIVSGATDTSNAFVQSMQYALSQAKS